MSGTVTTINTALQGARGANGTTAGAAGGDAPAADESAQPFSNEDLTPLASQLAISGGLFPSVTAGVGGAGAGGSQGANGVGTTVSNTDLNGNVINNTTYTPGNPGGPGGAGGGGGEATLTLANDSLGSVASPYGASFTIRATTTGGLGGTGGSGGSGGSGGNNVDDVFNNITTTTNLSAGAAGGNGNTGGSGGDGGAAATEVSGLTSYTSVGVGVTIAAIGGTGGGTSGISGGSGGSGGDASAGGNGGNGGNGGSAAATMAGSTMLDHNEISVSVVAKAGAGGMGGAGGPGGDAIFLTNLAEPAQRFDYGTNGNGGNGGNGGSAIATLTGDSLTAPAVTVSLSAEGNVGGAGGAGGTEGVSHSTATSSTGVSAPGAAGATGSSGSGSLIFTNDTITVGTPAVVGFAGELILGLAIANPGTSTSYVPLDGSAGGNLEFSGNDLAGAGNSQLDLQLSGTGTAVVNTLNNTLSIDGSPDNTMTGFTDFAIDDNDTFYVGPGAYQVQYASDADTLVYTPASGDVTVSNVNAGNLVLDFEGFGSSVDAASVPSDVSTSGGNTFIHIPNSGTIELQGFSGAIPSGDLEFNVLCFCAGTRIATPTGEVPVEHLSPGDKVLTLRGEVRPIVWIGTGRVLATRGRRNAATPVIVRKGALADTVPHRDLRVTKGHSLYLDGALIPVECLVNHRSILWDDRAQEVAIYHVELATHDVLLADGAPAESYRDDGNRWLFRNSNGGWAGPPQEPCAPVLTGGPLVDRAWRRLLDRAGPRPGLTLTDDPDLHLMMDGERLEAMSRHGAAYLFHLSARPATVWVASRAAAPAELGLARDPRVLGVALQRIAVRQGTRFRLMEAADASLAQGFHGFEPDSGLRWTDGRAELPEALFEGFVGPMELVLHLGCATQYLLLNETSRSVAA